ncbi:transcription inhibitor protein Gfh1 [Ruminiclostridium hungatei]|uniref:Transcription inhibitor protein Gfh1 n=1 Tax=Ruminiclostridium hungatei TaxID=48256 RepID=A0A1V4SIA7_RUMHU|nr:GreA/GreB family elongation factor [Ruminiclostridium hungatei]OPX43544.1 transcription inhibitor protein Gfh1 [Ruminiclostridium hungatei]
MTKRLVMAVPVYENLLAHLVDFEERRSHIIDLYYPELGKQREEFEQLMDSYISEVDIAVKNVLFSDEANNYFPFVCLNSEVEIEDIEELETYSYKLIIPENSRSESNCITILSPMGKALLCKKEGDIVSVNTPSGVYRYRIKSIKLK